MTDVAETVQSLVKGLVLLGKVDADDVLDVLLEEGRAGDAGYAYLPGHLLAEPRRSWTASSSTTISIP